jgi:sulfonate transport system substrate-binding protein
MRSARVVAAAVVLLLAAGLADAGERVRVGYFPNLAHAPAIVGLAHGSFARALGESTSIETRVFNAGPAEIEALFAGEIDLGYVGPAPGITGFVRSKGRALRVVAGAAMGGASLVVRADSGIRDTASLSGKKLAAPQIGNTQDVALRTYLRAAGLRTSDKGGAVVVMPVANPDILTLFAKKEIDGAWVPEPWASILRWRVGATELVDERSLWPGGKMPTTVVIVSTRFLASHRPAVVAWLRAQRETMRWIEQNPAEAKALVNRAIGDLTTREIAPEVLDDAWGRLAFSDEIAVEALAKLAKDAEALGYLPASDVATLCDTTLLRDAAAQ